MRILVCIKQVLVPGDEIVFGEDGCDVDPACLDAALNEWDSYAIEEGLQLRETHGGEVVAVTCGDPDAEPVLRRALAMGVDRAARIDGGATDPYSVGKALAAYAERLQPDLILCGAQSWDSAHAATGTVVAGVLGVPCVAVARALEADPAQGRAIVERELEGGVVDRLRLPLPMVVTVQTGINQPRYANLRAIKLAEKEPIERIAAPAAQPAYRIRRMFAPSAQRNAASLGDDLRQAAERIAQLIRERST